jgi:hypothetical protein
MKTDFQKNLFFVNNLETHVNKIFRKNTYSFNPFNAQFNNLEINHILLFMCLHNNYFHVGQPQGASYIKSQEMAEEFIFTDILNTEDTFKYKWLCF